jgi:rod shape-determining protein MreB
VTGLPKAGDVSSVELREAISQPVSEIVEVVRTALEETPPELVADIMQHGITLAGGGALLKGLDKRINIETKMPVNIAEDPLTCVVRGAGRIVEALEQYDRILRSSAQNRRAIIVTQ